MFSSALSEIFWEVLEKFVATHGSRVTEFPASFVRNRAVAYADAIFQGGAALDKCVGFIDGTKIKCARPGGSAANQRCVYSGHKRCHCLTYQTVTVPDGLILHLYGPCEGRQPDILLSSRSGLETVLRNTLLIGS